MSQKFTRASATLLISHISASQGDQDPRVGLISSQDKLQGVK
jgi:hypothetical protein